MKKIINQWEQVADPSYFRQILGNMVALGYGRKHEGKSHVRFGTTGIGHSPNYQIEGDNGLKNCFRGQNHEQSPEDEFDDSNLSEDRFTYSEVQAMLARLTNGVS